MLYKISDKDWSIIRRQIKEVVNKSTANERTIVATNVRRMSFGIIELEGGVIPITFDVYSFELFVRSRGARKAGNSINLDDLISIHCALVEYFSQLQDNGLKPIEPKV